MITAPCPCGRRPRGRNDLLLALRHLLCGDRGRGKGNARREGARLLPRHFAEPGCDVRVPHGIGDRNVPDREADALHEPEPLARPDRSPVRVRGRGRSPRHDRGRGRLVRHERMAIASSCPNAKTALISVPVKYMHSTLEVADINCIDSAAKIIAEFAERGDF